MNKLQKKFPSYFSNFELPHGAKEQNIEVYRACKTQKVDRQSFIPSFEENGYKNCNGGDLLDPGLYSLSTYEKPKDVKRFANTNSKFQPPYKIAKGFTNPICGPSQRTKERKKTKSSHVDWWLYENAKPYKHFNLIKDFKKYYDDYKKKGESHNE